MKSLLFTACFFLIAISSIGQVSEKERQAANQFLKQKGVSIGLKADEVSNSKVNDAYTIPGSDVHMIYLQQTIDGIPIQGEMKVLAIKNDVLKSSAGEMMDFSKLKARKLSSIPAVSSSAAVLAAANFLKEQYGKPDANSIPTGWGNPAHPQLSSVAKNPMQKNSTGTSLSGIDVKKLSDSLKTNSSKNKQGGFPSTNQFDKKDSIKEYRSLNISSNALSASQLRQADGKINYGKLDYSLENVTAELVWLPTENKEELKLVWQVFVAPIDDEDYWLVRIDANTGAFVNKVSLTVKCNWGDGHAHAQNGEHIEHNYAVAENTVPDNKFQLQSNEQFQAQSPSAVNSALYRVIKYPAESPIHPGGAHTVVTNPWAMTPGNATSLGWHTDSAATYTSTRGNNVYAYEDRDNYNIPGNAEQSNLPEPTLYFTYAAPDFTKNPTDRSPAANQQFAVTNLFYWNNLMHDLSYLYGFTEASRNFQSYNMGRGGLGNDYVSAEAQDGGDVTQGGTYNNANFSTPPDGNKGRMQMYLWNLKKPFIDGDLDNGIIAHEYTHGISNRLTGDGYSCLRNYEQMGEGWSDYFALIATQDWATSVASDGFNKPRTIGTYALNQPINGPGIRKYPYSTNMAINPLTYAYLTKETVPHGIGAIWCNTLWDMTWEIIQMDGINVNLFNPTGGGGNVVALKLITEGMRLQPCSPGFIDGRNAILKADTLFFNGKYSCAIMKAFAKRGMGIGASQGSSNVLGDEKLSFIDCASPCTAPQNLRPSNAKASSVKLNWDATGNIKNYLVEYKLNTSNAWIIVGITENNFIDISGLTQNTQYNWRVTSNCLNDAVLTSIADFATTPTGCATSYEPNADLSEATPIALNIDIFSAIGTPGDQDFFKVTTTTAGRLSVLLSNLPTNYDFSIVDTAFHDIEFTSFPSRTDSADKLITLRNNVGAGTYYVIVYSNFGTYNPDQCYKLNVKLLDTAGCASIYDPTTSYYQYFFNPLTIPLNTDIKGDLGLQSFWFKYFADEFDAKDYYHFKITGTGGTSTNISVTNLPDNYDMYLYAADSVTLLGKSVNTGTTNELISKTLGAGDYYIMLLTKNSVSSINSCYTLRVSTAALPCDNSYEANETSQTAANIELNKDIFAAIGSNTDVDYYKITTPAVDGTLTIQLSNLPADYNLYLYNFLGTLIDSSLSTGTRNETIVLDNQDTDIYYIKVIGANGAFSATDCYKLNADLSPYCVNGYEANNTYQTAVVLPLNSSISAGLGKLNDLDWYKITTTELGNLNIDLTNLPADYDMVLYSSNGIFYPRYVALSGKTGTANEKINVNLPAGIYYLVVQGDFLTQAFDSKNCYSLSANFNAAPIGCQSIYDQDVSFSTIPFNTDIKGKITEPRDVDFYNFRITGEGTVVNIVLSGLTQDYDFVIEHSLPNNMGTRLIATSDNSGLNNEILKLALPAGSFNVGVYSHSGFYGGSTIVDTANCYNLKVAITTPESFACSNAYESNETQATAAAIAPATAVYAAIGSSTDIDYYKITTLEAGNYTFTLNNLPADYNLYLYDAAGVQIGSSVTTGSNAETITLNNQSAGTYFIKIVGANAAFNAAACYLLTVKLESTLCINNYEPNETFATAAQVPLNTVISGSLTLTTDKDYYKVTTTSFGNLYIAFKDNPAYTVTVYNSAGTLISTGYGFTNGNLQISNLAAGTYYLLLDGITINPAIFLNSNCYNVTFSTTAANTQQCTSSYESNETIATAAVINTNEIISSAIGSATDVDYFKVTTSYASKFDIRLSGYPGFLSNFFIGGNNDYNLYLYNSNGTLIDSSVRTGNNFERIKSSTQPAGTYYVKVVGVNGAFSTSGCYYLSFLLPPDCIFAYENNQTMQTAAAIPLNTIINAGMETDGLSIFDNNVNTDIDYYKIATTTTGNFFITLDNKGATNLGFPSDYDLFLYNAAGQQIGSSTLAGGSKEAISLGNQPAGTYYIKIKGYYNFSRSSIICYELKAGFTASCVEAYEPNNQLPSNVTIPLNTTISAGIGSPTDYDIYKIITPASGNFEIVLSNLPDDYDVFLFNSTSNTSIGGSLNPGTANDTIKLNNLAAGTYYVVVASLDSFYNLTACYNLRVGFTPSCISAYEPNQTLAAAVTVPVNNVLSAGIGSNIDADWYKVTTTSTGNFSVLLSNLPFDYDLYMYNAAGGLIGSSLRGGTSNDLITLGNQPAGTYHVKVIGWAGALSTSVCYNLNIGFTGNTLFAKGTTEPVSDSSSTKIESENISKTLLYPNPARDKITVQIGDFKNKATIRIMDVSGRILSEQNVNNAVSTLNIGNLVSGTYLVNILSNEKLTTLRFVKE
jgi:Fungalysin metallopeptidase (M36)/Secretion system C-terminal sorting domain/Fibronectin type III domain/Bacterial pre-peptidase C-terminal domain